MQEMKQTNSFKEKFTQFFLILFPILVTQIAMFSMTFFDTVMSGQVSTYDLAGVAIGSSLWHPISTGIGGIFLAITPIISQLIGANHKDKIPYKIMQGIYLAVMVSFILILIGSVLLDTILSLMSLEPPVHKIARNFLMYLAFGIIPFFIYQVFRCFIDALGKTLVSMVITLLALPINITLNYILIFGKLGVPAFGGAGSGIATALTYWCLALIAAGMIHYHPSFSDYKTFKRIYPISFKAWFEQLKLGIPIGFSIFFESSIFSAVTLLMSSFSTITIAAHQGAYNVSSMFYMIPLSMSMALTILVGFEVGARRYKDASQYIKLGIATALTISLFTSVLLFIFREQVAGIYSKDLQVIELTKQFLIFAICFQILDAIATPIQGVLRGYKDVNITFVFSLIAYWAIALPGGYLLAHYTSLGAFGYWVGLILGIAFNGVALLLRLRFMQNQKYTATGNH